MRLLPHDRYSTGDRPCRAQKSWGTNRISNLTLACHACNQTKGALTADEFGHPEIQAQAQRPLKDAAAVNSTRWALSRGLQACRVPVETGTGGRTKWNRTRFGLPKTHALDALCVGLVDHVTCGYQSVLTIHATGRGAYQRTRVTAAGFPRGFLMRKKSIKGFRTGDLVRAVVPTGKKIGVYTGRVAVRASGRFNIQTATTTIQCLAHRHCRRLMRADGYTYHLKTINQDAPPPRPKGRTARRGRN